MKKIKKIELLAPCGNTSSLIAAVENGADAVYLGGKSFHARHFAENFEELELEKALDYALQRDIKVYLTLNTLLKDDEIRPALELAEKAYMLGISGIIVQDLGFSQIIRKELPDIPLHASTQMTVHNQAGVLALFKLGFRRVILSRELSMREIADIAKDSPLEIEIFVHGALCVCYSGQCLLSSVIGERSGNRGKCGQACRWKWELHTQNHMACSGHLLSPKDLNGLEYVLPLQEAGVCSLKIEGRMKSPEYVATVVRIYRTFIDHHAISEQDKKDLQQVFNRGFTSSYLAGTPKQNLLSVDKPKNHGIYLGEVMGVDKRNKAISIQCEEEICLGDGIEIWNGENESPSALVSQIVVDGKRIADAKQSIVLGGKNATKIVTLGDISGNISLGNRVYKTSSKKLCDYAKETFRNGWNQNIRRVALWGKLICTSHALCLRVWDAQQNEIDVSLPIAQETCDTTRQTRSDTKILGQLSKTGSTPFDFVHIDLDIQGPCLATVSEINQIRRLALDKIIQTRLESHRRPAPQKSSHHISPDTPSTDIDTNKASLLYTTLDRIQHVSIDTPHPITMESVIGTIQHVGHDKADTTNPTNTSYSATTMKSVYDDMQIKDVSHRKVCVFFHRWQKAYEDLPLRDVRVYIPISSIISTIAAGNPWILPWKENVEYYAWIPSITRAEYHAKVLSYLPTIFQHGIIGILAGNWGILTDIAEYFPNIPRIGNYNLNVFNSQSLEICAQQSLQCITLSPEMNLEQIQNLHFPSNICSEVLTYGRLAVMITENCPQTMQHAKRLLSHSPKCPCCNTNEYYVQDSIGMKFPIFCDPMTGQSTILNCKILFVPHIISKILSCGITSIRLNVYEETTSQIIQIVGLYQRALRGCNETKFPFGSPENFTQGHYFRNV